MQTEIMGVSRLGTLEVFSGEPLELHVPSELFSLALSFFDAAFYEDGDEDRLKALAQIARQHKQGVEQIVSDELRSAKARNDNRQKAHKAFDAIENGKLLALLPDGKVRVQGSSSIYVVGCDCTVEGRSTTNKKTGKHGPAYCPTYTGGKQGSCYHIWMRELVRMAQVFFLTDGAGNLL